MLHFLFLIFLGLVHSESYYKPKNGYNLLELHPNTEIQVEIRVPQSFILFPNPDPLQFKLEVIVKNRNSTKILFPFQDNTPILNSLKQDPKSQAMLLEENDQKNSPNKRTDLEHHPNEKESNNQAEAEEKTPRTPDEYKKRYRANKKYIKEMNERRKQILKLMGSQNNHKTSSKRRKPKHKLPTDVDNQISDQNKTEQPTDFNQQNISQINSQQNPNKSENSHLFSENKTNPEIQDLPFGIYSGNNIVRVTFISVQSTKVSIPFYFLRSPKIAREVYFSTHPNDIFSLGKSIEFPISLGSSNRYIHYWNVCGQPVYYEMSYHDVNSDDLFYNLKDGEINPINLTKDQQTLAEPNSFLFLGCHLKPETGNRAFKLLIRDEDNKNSYNKQFRSAEMDLYIDSLRQNSQYRLPPTRYQFNFQSGAQILVANHKFGNFKRFRNIFPLAPLSLSAPEFGSSSTTDDQQSNFFKYLLIFLVVIAVILLIIFSTVMKLINLQNHSAGFGQGFQRQTKRKKHRVYHRHHRKKRTRPYDDFQDDNDPFISDEYNESSDIDDGNLTMSKKKKRSAEMDSIIKELMAKRSGY